MPTVEEAIEDFNILYDMFSRAGKKTFKPTSDLLVMLQNTELYSSLDMVKLPASTIFVVLPVKHQIRESINCLTQPGKLDKGVYLLQDYCNHGSSRITVYPDNGTHVLHFSLSPNATARDVAMQFGNKQCINDAEIVIKVIVNLITYLTSAHAVKETFADTLEYIKLCSKIKTTNNPIKKRKLTKKLEDKKSQYGIVLGKDIIIDRSRLSVSHDSMMAIEKKISSRHWVIGHWRNQACGIGLKDRKIIWIKPFLRGPQDSPIVLKQHKVR